MLHYFFDDRYEYDDLSAFPRKLWGWFIGAGTMEAGAGKLLDWYDRSGDYLLGGVM